MFDGEFTDHVEQLHQTHGIPTQRSYQATILPTNSYICREEMERRSQMSKPHA